MSQMKNIAIDEVQRKRDYADMSIHLAVSEGREVLSRAEVLDIVHQALTSWEKRHEFMKNPMFPESEE
jgi:hypothetical protein